VLSADGQNEVGKVSKQWSGLAKEMFTDADNFGITCKEHAWSGCQGNFTSTHFLFSFMIFIIYFLSI